jgi:hypothetical protein
MPLPIGKLIPMTPPILPHTGLRQVIFGIVLAFLVVPNSVLVLGYGLAGSLGSSLITGTLLTVAVVATGLLCFRRQIVLLPVDYLFFAFLLCIVLSFASNGWTSTAKEYGLLVLSLAAYPACRFISRADMIAGRPSFIWATGIVVLLGTTATAPALWQQWDNGHGKPFVFGFDAAGTYFLVSLCFLIIALLTAGRLTLRRTALLSSLIFLPAALFAASFVRFTFIALAGALCLATMLSEAKQRKHVVAVALVIFVAIAAGLLARYNQAKIYADYVVEQSFGDYVVEQSSGDYVVAQSSGDARGEKLPSCYLKVNLRNSIAIRKVLIQDAVLLMPRSGWIGIGLDSFMKLSCIQMTEVHNSILQATVEFGWLGGALLLFIIVVAGGSILPLARYDNTSRFVLCSLAFAVLLSLAHGRVSRDAVLFALLGCAVGLKETFRVPTRQAMSAVTA